MSELIPIDTIESDEEPLEGEPFVPQALSYDPDANDGSASREGVNVSKWRLRTLSGDRLGSVSEPSGRDRRSRKARRMHNASRKARSKSKRSSRGIVRVVVALLLAVAVIGAVYAGVTYALEIWGGRTIPSVKGWVAANAIAELESHGFKVATQEVYSDSAEGRVIEMSPESGVRYEEGGTVTLSVGMYRTIPEVVGMTEAQARDTLAKAGAENVRLRSEVMLEDEDRVLEVIPAAGSRFMSSDEITLVVTQLPLLPDVVGDDEAVARARLKYDGIPVTTQFERSTVENRLLVVRTDPEADTRIGNEGVILFVGDPLVQITRLTDYFDATASHIAAFVAGEGYTPRVGHLTQDGHMVVSYSHADGSKISFVSDPWSR
ncbi:MAG: PASTA domain-containing protein, partial [Coriobacteriales bacterium]|nr:PASTA domain-containing protein [Coriobacteriales bacterium]